MVLQKRLLVCIGVNVCREECFVYVLDVCYDKTFHVTVAAAVSHQLANRGCSANQRTHR